jgi:hypothetical protein
VEGTGAENANTRKPMDLEATREAERGENEDGLLNLSDALKAA